MPLNIAMQNRSGTEMVLYDLSRIVVVREFAGPILDFACFIYLSILYKLARYLL